MQDGFIKVAAGTPRVRVADCAHNAKEIISLILQAEQEGVKLLALPELCLTGYTCGDLFLQSVLLDGAEQALSEILTATADTEVLTAVGLPIRSPWDGKLYNCAALLQGGHILGLIPKTHIPNYGEFYEGRWFASGKGLDVSVPLCGEQVNLSSRLLWICETMPDLVVGVELCEDLWVPDPPSRALCENGATVILNLSASDETAGKSAYRRELVKHQSARCLCGYVYANAGEGESTTDLVFSGHNLIAENGTVLAERRFEGGLTISEIDVARLAYERRRMNTFAPTLDPMTEAHLLGICRASFSLTPTVTPLTRSVSPSPFLPSERDDRAQRCEELFTLSALGLKKRLEHTHTASSVIGLSGGLDSTLALLTTVRAYDLLGRDRRDILTVTMPCFGTTRRTRSNAEVLAAELGVSFREINISKSVEQHFADIGQSPEDHSVTFENAQARERTQVLMDVANQIGGMVIGTGDLSELALGWCTYNGDHMSMYAVNASIPKTLVRHLVSYEAERLGGQADAVLRDILDTPVSPELLPPKDGEIAQVTEDIVGPYELHDFFLYYAVRWGFAPKKLLRLAEHAFGGRYDRGTLLKWLKNFYRRFFSQQFKRSCLPDGVKVGSLTLSPRGDWRMPSDAVATLWLNEVEKL